MWDLLYFFFEVFEIGKNFVPAILILDWLPLGYYETVIHEKWRAQKIYQAQSIFIAGYLLIPIPKKKSWNPVFWLHI